MTEHPMDPSRSNEAIYERKGRAGLEAVRAELARHDGLPAHDHREGVTCPRCPNESEEACPR